MAKKKSKRPAAAELSFEQAIERLEQIVHQLEEGEIGLDEALKRYEEGVRLLRQCYELLETAQRRIELLSGVDADGNPVSAPLDDTSDSPDESVRGRSGQRSRQRSEGIPPEHGDPEAEGNDMDVSDGLL